MKLITSCQNNLIKEISKLKNTKDRKSSKFFCVEGLKLANELLSSGYQPVYCFVMQGTNRTDIPSGISDDILYFVSEQVMKKISSFSSLPQILIVAKEKQSIVNVNFEKFILALDSVQDPSNLGAILRSAEAFSVKTIILGQGCCDCYSAKALRSSMGSVFRLNIINADLVEYLRDKKQVGYHIIGTGLDRKYKTVDKLYESPKKIVVIGNEGNGISDKVKEICDFGMFIPMYGENESLNAAVAASIIMWEFKRQENE